MVGMLEIEGLGSGQTQSPGLLQQVEVGIHYCV